VEPDDLDDDLVRQQGVMSVDGFQRSEALIPSAGQPRLSTWAHTILFVFFGGLGTGSAVGLGAAGAISLTAREPR
jgi:hypothetical protein